MCCCVAVLVLLCWLDCGWLITSYYSLGYVAEGRTEFVRERVDKACETWSAIAEGKTVAVNQRVATRGEKR